MTRTERSATQAPRGGRKKGGHTLTGWWGRYFCSDNVVQSLKGMRMCACAAILDCAALPLPALLSRSAAGPVWASREAVHPARRQRPVGSWQPPGEGTPLHAASAAQPSVRAPRSAHTPIPAPCSSCSPAHSACPPPSLATHMQQQHSAARHAVRQASAPGLPCCTYTCCGWCPCWP